MKKAKTKRLKKARSCTASMKSLKQNFIDKIKSCSAILNPEHIENCWSKHGMAGRKHWKIISCAKRLSHGNNIEVYGEEKVRAKRKAMFDGLESRLAKDAKYLTGLGFLLKTA